MQGADPDTLFEREKLPDDLRFLLDSYPRASWGSVHSLGDMGTFWMRRHDMFRELGGSLKTAALDLREGRSAAEPFAAWFAPRLRFFLRELNSHHHIEDHHYFPVFSAAEPKLQRGFDILDSDHHLIHDLLEANAAAGNDFLRAKAVGGDPLKRAVDAYGAGIDHLLVGLLRHLEDEEDLIVPLLLDRGEDVLGVH